jgi:hypothetical protein
VNAVELKELHDFVASVVSVPETKAFTQLDKLLDVKLVESEDADGEAHFFWEVDWGILVHALLYGDGPHIHDRSDRL